MAKESAFVKVALDTAIAVLKPPLSIRRGAALLYQVTVDNKLNLTVDPKSPRRGTSAFETDLCVFERKSADALIPRAVIEFKTGITTHDVLTYSAKARKHKQAYPYLRYGIVTSDKRNVPGRFFTHNESLDFGIAVGGLSKNKFKDLFMALIKQEVAASRRLEAISFGSLKVRLYRSAVNIIAL